MTEAKTEICPHCWAEFTVKKPGQKYCSAKCRNQVKYLKAKENKPVKEPKTEGRNCGNCGKLFIWLSSYPHKKYCSRRCREIVKIEKTKLKRLNGFDDKKVKWLVSQVNSTYEKGIDQTNVNGFTESLKETIRCRDDYECQVCNKTTDLEVHHIIPRKKGGQHRINNLITLCKGCHKYIEAGDEVKAVNKCFRNFKKQNFVKDDTI